MSDDDHPKSTLAVQGPAPMPRQEPLAVVLPERTGKPLKLEDCDIYQRAILNPRKSNGRMDDDAKVRAIEAYANFGTYATAARAAHVCPQTIKNHMDSDPDFKDAMETSLTEFRDKLEQEAYRRAVEGVTKPVFSQKLGRIIGYEQVYSDGLLQFIMKKWMPDYREKVQTDVNVMGGVLVLASSRSKSIEEFEEKHAGKTYIPTKDYIDVTPEGEDQ